MAEKIKQKTHRGAAKRFAKTGSGRIKRGKSNTSHILTKKSAKRKLHLRQRTVVSKADTDRIERMLGEK